MATRAKRAESRARYYIRSQSSKRGWDVRHVDKGGDLLEEQEIIGHFPGIGLGLEKPDFIYCIAGEPMVVVEAKNDIRKIDQAINQAIGYAETINATGTFRIPVAIGAAGEEDAGFAVEVRYLTDTGWKPLKSHGFAITNIPSKREIELAVEANDATTEVTIPSSVEFIDAAIELSSLLRKARIEAPLRPKVIGALTLAMYKGDVDTSSEAALESINSLVHSAIHESIDIGEEKKTRLEDALRLSGADFERLSPHISRAVSLLKRLNIRSVLKTDTDFLGIFYEAFLRYGYDNNALGIVFTPRHITRFCVELLDVQPNDRVIDIASGTGGFLVAAFDKMIKQAESRAAIDWIKSSMHGFDTNPTIWALATLNMFFRGDGKSHIENTSCFEGLDQVRGRFTKAFLNPPFSQEGEPERDFINASLEALEPGGMLATVVIAGVFADDEHVAWRRELTRNHSVVAVISLPEDLFYPTAAPTSIFIVKAHRPQQPSDTILMARIWNDGYQKLKGRRVEIEGSQLPEIGEAYHNVLRGEVYHSDNATTINAALIMDGEEFSPQQWLPQSHLSQDELEIVERKTIMSMYQTAAVMPEIVDSVMGDFGWASSELPSLEYGKKASISHFFTVLNGRSSGEKNYSDGPLPYVSSGDTTNSIVRLVQPAEDEIFTEGGITVTAFGQAYVQPWPFMARGNGGSSVRVLIPKFAMSNRELIWFAGQINAQRWRFFYARMAIKSRLTRLEVESPVQPLPDGIRTIESRLVEFRNTLLELSNYSVEGE